MALDLNAAIHHANNAATNLYRYLDHESYCEIDKTDFCTCGLPNAKRNFDEAIKNIITIARGAGK